MWLKPPAIQSAYHLARERYASLGVDGGIALIILPTVIVGNELLILAGVAAAVGLWFLAHRHGQLRGLVDSANGAGDTTKKHL